MRFNPPLTAESSSMLSSYFIFVSCLRLAKRCGDFGKMASARKQRDIPDNLDKLKDRGVAASYGVHFFDRQFFGEQFAVQIGHVIPLRLGRDHPLMHGGRGDMKSRSLAV
jgi:hypothetical protein